MLKIISIIVIILICGYIGFSLSKYYINRKKFFNELNLFLNSLNLDINFTQDKLANVLGKNIQNINSQELKIFINNYLQQITEKSLLNKDKLFDKITILKNNEEEYLYTFFKGIGRLDCENQSKEFEKYSCVIESSIQEASKEATKYSSLYTKLGIIFGLFIALILL